MTCPMDDEITDPMIEADKTPTGELTSLLSGDSDKARALWSSLASAWPMPSVSTSSKTTSICRGDMPMAFMLGRNSSRSMDSLSSAPSTGALFSSSAGADGDSSFSGERGDDGDGGGDGIGDGTSLPRTTCGDAAGELISSMTIKMLSTTGADIRWHTPSIGTTGADICCLSPSIGDSGGEGVGEGGATSKDRASERFTAGL